MNPRPFYRSSAFWFGLLGLVFLLWGWCVSMGHRFWFDNGSLGIGLSAGEVYAYSIFKPDWGDIWGDIGVGHYEVEPEEALEWKRKLAEGTDVMPDFRITFIPYQWLVLGYVAGWLLTLAWWQRRKSRLLNLYTAP